MSDTMHHQQRTEKAAAVAWNEGKAEDRQDSTVMALWEIARNLAVIADATVIDDE